MFDYLLTRSYSGYSGFLLYIHDRAQKLKAEGIEIDIMN